MDKTEVEAARVADMKPLPPLVTGGSLRDWFAGLALQGLLSGVYQDSPHLHVLIVPEEAYAIADAMLAARTALAKSEGRS